ncbi:MAG: hypothetical protein IPM58_08180 [Nitrospira sp.]|nr:hypothetical protein [Nitrospira sp.]
MRRSDQRPLCCTLTCIALISLLVWISSCSRATDSSSMDSNRETERNRMVDQYIVPRGIKNPAVIAAMRHVPRHRLVPGKYALFAYLDGPLSIGHGQTISQPSLVAEMTDVLS